MEEAAVSEGNDLSSADGGAGCCFRHALAIGADEEGANEARWLLLLLSILGVTFDGDSEARLSPQLPLP